jgi:hypothetical protein
MNSLSSLDFLRVGLRMRRCRICSIKTELPGWRRWRMSYSAVPTVATGDNWSASDHNTYVKDNFAAGIPDIFTAAGDIGYASGADAATRLAIGTAGQLLVSNGSAPTWNGHNGCSLTRTSAQTISNASATDILWDSENFDTDGFHSTSTNTDRIVIPTGLDGYYWVFALVQYDGDSTGSRETKLKLNGTAISFYASEGEAVGHSHPIGKVVSLSAADYLELEVYQTSGGNLDILQQYGTPLFGAVRLL